MNYPLNAKKLIAALEAESGAKMEPELKQLWECLVPLLNDAYESGRQGKTYSSCWVKKWKAYFGSEPDPKMKRWLELTDSIMNRAYEEGRQHPAAALVHFQKGGAAI